MAEIYGESGSGTGQHNRAGWAPVVIGIVVLLALIAAIVLMRQ